MLCLVAQLCPILCNLVDCTPPVSSVCGYSRGRNSGVGCHALLQRNVPTQDLNPGLQHCRWILYSLSHQVKPKSSPNAENIYKDRRPIKCYYWISIKPDCDETHFIDKQSAKEFAKAEINLDIIQSVKDAGFKIQSQMTPEIRLISSQRTRRYSSIFLDDYISKIRLSDPWRDIAEFWNWQFKNLHKFG